MVIKVYNQNGKVKITKTINRRELVMVSDLADGEVAEIDIDVSQYTMTRRTRKKTGDGRENAVSLLLLAADDGALNKREAQRAAAVLEGRWENDIPDAWISGSIFFEHAIKILRAAVDNGDLAPGEAEKAVEKLENAV